MHTAILSFCDADAHLMFVRHEFIVFLLPLQKIFFEMNVIGIIIGIATFLIIGLFHPLVIKSEYYFGVKIWWIFAIVGIVGLVSSLFIDDVLFSTLAAVFGASSLWSVHELFEQKKRVEKGWFPKREKRTNNNEK